MSGLIWIHTDTDDIPEIFFEKVNFLKKSTDNKKACKITQHAMLIWTSNICYIAPDKRVSWAQLFKTNDVVS